ncbi:SDR family NAD(P)-dependent oxidoreductase [Mycobacterium intracellulare]|uniref:SDR family NAD(P)-dependent oxidoreductase n=1 Tax=Mycobacterium intracellulare TaxID=1767 RepID=UPI000BAC2277|nr:SDR family oxidoreductase [Mycobacterium intracellulare]ASW98578.1 short-chain dehydrogenase [Mycobacterium intracellulare subsp. chimaera]PBA61177.1 short-chain dehydrogenase [Mycobacterium intracellulare subsp. chimaera]PBA61405.1 short-chain dehydrogenase [Mycobacterium intracellulare subsp. chimaera]
MTADFTDHVAVITGASGGIGRILARRYAQCGATVALVARRRDELERTADVIAEEGGVASIHVADIRDEAQCGDLVAAVLARWGRLDVLVNNAAVPGVDQSVSEATVANWQDVLATNLVAPMVLAREALRAAMIPVQRGNVQFVSSAAARNVQPRKAHYAAAKLGLTALAQTLALEVGALGIRVNTLVVGSVAGELLDRYVARRAREDGLDPGELRQRLASQNTLRRLVQPDEIAEVSMWLASDAASAITGQDVNVTGG